MPYFFLVLLPSCVTVPVAMPPFQHSTEELSLEQRQAKYLKHAIPDDWSKSRPTDGEIPRPLPSKDYFLASGDKESADRWGGAANWLLLSTVPLIGGYGSALRGAFYLDEAIWLEPLAIGFLGLFKWINLAQRRQERTAIQSFNQFLRKDLGLPDPAENFEGQAKPSAPDGSGLYFVALIGGQEASNQDERSYFDDTFSIPTRNWTNEMAEIGAGWSHETGLGIEATVQFPGQKVYGIRYWRTQPDNIVAAQSISLSAAGLNIRLLDNINILPDYETAVSFGVALGWNRLWGYNEIGDTAGQTIGLERFNSDCFAFGPLCRLSSRMLDDGIGLEMGYVWRRYNGVDVYESRGTLKGAKAGQDWQGRPEFWDFSGPYVNLVFEFGKLPWSH